VCRLAAAHAVCNPMQLAVCPDVLQCSRNVPHSTATSSHLTAYFPYRIIVLFDLTLQISYILKQIAGTDLDMLTATQAQNCPLVIGRGSVSVFTNRSVSGHCHEGKRTQFAIVQWGYKLGARDERYFLHFVRTDSEDLPSLVPTGNRGLFRLD
jgi:hypothetical protein